MLLLLGTLQAYRVWNVPLSLSFSSVLVKYSTTAACWQTPRPGSSLTDVRPSLKLWRVRENQQDATIRCLLSTLSQHVSGIIMPIFRRTKTVCYCMRCSSLVLLDVVGSGCGALRCRVLLKMGIMMPETCWDGVDNKHLIVASCWFSLSLHNLLTMHGHRNLKHLWNVYTIQMSTCGWASHHRTVLEVFCRYPRV